MAMAERDTVLRWLGYASHDVANPVTSLRLLAELALGSAEGSIKEDLEDIMVEADFATVLLDSMGRVSSRLRDQDHDLPTWFEVDLLHLVQRAASRPAFRRVVQLEIEPGMTEALLLGDSKRLEEVFHDVFANARRLGSGRAIKVQMGKSDGRFEVLVDHAPPGLTTEQCEQLVCTETVLDLRDQSIPVAAGGWVHAASVIEMHDGEMRFETLASGALRLRIAFAPIGTRGPLGDEVPGVP